MTTFTITLYSEGLLSKWGFGDGDQYYDEWLDYWEARGVDLSDAPGFPLVELVKRYLVPALDQKVEVEVLDTIHNPVRAVAVDGVDVTNQWRNVGHTTKLTPESVTVPFAEVLRIAQEQRPQK